MHRSVGATATSVNHRAGDGGVAGMGRPRVTVVLPTRNEARNLPHVAERMPPVDELVVIDGGSQDGTADVARRLWPYATVIEQTRSGKGNALACGFRAATGDIIVMIEEVHGKPIRAGQSFSAAYVVGYFDDIPQMHSVYEQHKGHTRLTADASRWRLKK